MGSARKASEIDLHAGMPKRLSGLTGNLDAFIHEIGIEILGTQIACEVAFSAQPIGRELLGRH